MGMGAFLGVGMQGEDFAQTFLNLQPETLQLETIFPQLRRRKNCADETPRFFRLPAFRWKIIFPKHALPLR
jgi:hypothetical protein